MQWNLITTQEPIGTPIVNPDWEQQLQQMNERMPTSPAEIYDLHTDKNNDVSLK